MKETLEDSDISHPLNEALLKEAEDIKTERRTLKDRLDKLEETRSSVSEAVYQKVRADYAGKMNRTTEKLVALKKDLEAEEKNLADKKSLVESSLKFHAEKIEEATLRHALGEFTAEEHKKIRVAEEKEIDRLEAALKKLAEGVERHRGIFAGEDLPAEKKQAERKPEPPPPPPTKKSTAKPAAGDRAAPPPPRASTEGEHTPAPTIRESSAPKPFSSLSNPAIESTARIKLEDRHTGTVTAVDRSAAPSSGNGSAARKASELAILENGKVVQTIVLDHNVYIGRSPSNDVVLKEHKVSRKHAEIQYVNGKYVLLDLESSNGTFVAGKKIAEYTLQPNDEITIGNTKMVFKG